MLHATPTPLTRYRFLTWNHSTDTVDTTFITCRGHPPSEPQRLDIDFIRSNVISSNLTVSLESFFQLNVFETFTSVPITIESDVITVTFRYCNISSLRIGRSIRITNSYSIRVIDVSKRRSYRIEFNVHHNPLDHRNVVHFTEPIIFEFDNQPVTTLTLVPTNAVGVHSVRMIVPAGSSLDNMFFNRLSLKSIDGLANWDVSLGSDFCNMFADCHELVDISALANWDVTLTWSFSGMFHNCYNLTDITALSNWNVKSASIFSNMFANTSLSSLHDLAKWDMSNAVLLTDMFSGITTLSTLCGIGGWNTRNVEKINGMFAKCTKLIDVADIGMWKTPKLTTIQNLFMGCIKLSNCDCLAELQVGSVTTMSYAFYKTGITNVKWMSNWDVRNVTDMTMMFRGSMLETLDGLEQWKMDKVSTLNLMFSATMIVSIDPIAEWNVNSAKTIEAMFSDCKCLMYANVIRGWPIPNSCKSQRVFNGCDVLEDKCVLQAWADERSPKLPPGRSSPLYRTIARM